MNRNVWHKVLIGLLSVLLAVLMAAPLFGGKDGSKTAVPGSAPGKEAAPNWDVLRGKWQRPDGGYIIDIRTVDGSGVLNAAYFNPNPINVATARATSDGGRLKVYVELRDKNYPGSNYNLVYDPADDCLRGKYYQAVARQYYEITFVRVKP